MTAAALTRAAIASVSAQTWHSVVRTLERIDMKAETVMQPNTTKHELSEADLDSANEEAFSNEGGAPKPEQDTPSPDAGECNGPRAADHPDAVLAGVRFPARRSGYPNNQITFDCESGAGLKQVRGRPRAEKDKP